MGERVLLLQLDGKLPNVALMRIAAHHRALGDVVELRRAGNENAVERQFWDRPDRVYASLIFERTRPVAERLRVVYPDAIIGGTGWDITTRIAEIRDGRFKVSFNQGINARALTEETAAAIASVDYRDGNMRERRIYTAWDNARDEARLFRGLRMLADAGVKPRHIMVYMLVGYWAGETHASRDDRRQKLRDFGARPYPMPFVRTPELVAFQRWVIGSYDKSIPWEMWMAARGEPRRLNVRATPQIHLPIAGLAE